MTTTGMIFKHQNDSYGTKEYWDGLINQNWIENFRNVQEKYETKQNYKNLFYRYLLPVKEVPAEYTIKTICDL